MVRFCQIDAKDDYYCGYKPVAFHDGTNQRQRLGSKNGRLAVLMQREYLTRLAALQEEIAMKYERLFDYDEPPAENTYTNGLTKVEYDAAKKEAEELYPGRQAQYYT